LDRGSAGAFPRFCGTLVGEVRAGPDLAVAPGSRFGAEVLKIEMPPRSFAEEHHGRSAPMGPISSTCTRHKRSVNLKPHGQGGGRRDLLTLAKDGRRSGWSNYPEPRENSALGIRIRVAEDGEPGAFILGEHLGDSVRTGGR